MSEDRCETCRYGEFTPEVQFKDAPGLVARHAKVRCRRYPREIEKRPNDWCGEHTPKGPLT